MIFLQGVKRSPQNVGDHFEIGFYSVTDHETFAVMADHNKRSFVLEVMWSGVSANVRNSKCARNASRE